MTIPGFNEDGNLPVGIHETTLAEVEKGFVYNLKRKQLFEGLKRLIKDLKEIGCKTIFIDGSFTTDKQLPRDIDVCWDERGLDCEMIDSKFPVIFDIEPPRLLQKNTYKCDVFPAYWEDTASGLLFLELFQKDKYSEGKKGILKINI